MPLRKRRRLYSAGVLAAVVAPFVLAPLAWGHLRHGYGPADSWRSLLVLPGRTHYAEGYSDEAFRALEAGQSEAEVLDALGPPLTRWDLGDGGSVWLFVLQADPHASCHRRDVIFDGDGRVERRNGFVFVELF